jgi:uncharacterized protein (TIGR02246 family)
VTNQQSDIQAVLDTYAAAARDVDAFVALYDEDVHIFDVWSTVATRGIDAWQAMVTDWFGAHPDELAQVTFNDVEIVGAGDAAFAHGEVTFTWESVTGERLRAMTNRFTFCLAQRNGAWKIVHEHASLPIDMASMTAIVAR